MAAVQNLYYNYYILLIISILISVVRFTMLLFLFLRQVKRFWSFIVKSAIEILNIILNYY